MVRSRTAAKPTAPTDSEPENADNLEVISIGSLYNGPWEKKYWSSSRGKDRYPYPVGYQAVRAHNGTTYKMEIVEGVNGPKFLISSDDGNSVSGKTPDFAWKEFQKKGCTRMKIWHGKRLSSKMDGLELFGLKNQVIQRLLRELGADINGIVERSIVSSNISNDVSKTQHDDCHPNVGTSPDLLVSLKRARVTGKRSRCELKKKKLNGRSGPQSVELACSSASDVKNETTLVQRSSTTNNGLEDEDGAQNQIDVSPSLSIKPSVGKTSNCIASQNDQLLNPIDISEDKKAGAVPSERQTGFLSSANKKSTEITENLSTEKLLHRSHDVEMKMTSLLVTADDKVIQSGSKESQGCIGNDLCDPDTLDLQENASDSAPSNLDKNTYSEPACEVSSEDLLNSKHEEVLRPDSNLSSEKNDFNSAGQDVANSMMSLLLPQAVPLLNKMVTEDVYGEQGEKIHKTNTGTEHMKSIVLDSFEYSQCEDLKNSEILSFNIAEVDKSSFSKEMCYPKSQEQLPGDLPNGPSTCCASELEFKNRPPDYDACVPDSVLDDMSPPDVCIPDSVLDDMSPAHDSFNSLKNGLSAGQDFTGEKTQDEAVGKTGNVKTMMMSSSQSPNIVYTRTLQGNCFSAKSPECDKIELGTRQMHTARDTVPPSKTIQTKNDKLCEPDDSAGLLLETLEAHSDIPDVQSNLAELNHSSQNPNPLSCENKCSGSKEAQFVSEPMVQRNQELKNNLNSSVKFVGCYMHPMPVSSLLLKTREDEIHICVLCGLTSQHRTLFTYKVATKGPNFGCPSVMAHTPIILPDPKYNFMGEIILERTGVELTPDGQYIVLIGSIKTPNCREGKIDCCCSTCTSVCSEKNALKIVHVESGYVSVLATLEAVEDLHCILVCEANRLVSVGESGRLQVWVMNSTWSEKIEYFIIPADGSTSPGIVELKRVPRCAHLVVGRNIYGEFSLWDITKLNCVSSFSAAKYPISEFFPISLFDLQTKGLGLSYASIEEKAEIFLEATNFWHSEQRETCVYLPTEDVAMCFLVSTPSDFDCCPNHVSTSSHHDVHTARSWRLALLVKNSIVFGSPLDPRTTTVGVSGGYGIISTSDGVVYMWELARGSKLDTLHHFHDGTVTSVATEDLNSNSRSAMGVAGDAGQLLLYLHLHDPNSKE
ncbi:uncharacterized protein LOC123882822 isoform X2 [Trifolium pratense]|uniref:uncharacterized protein LOC123882822 isoform X2 n=1 Tax=Trifolium pratense TaxID=57577 RepID=UPI001E694E18|nr:uncharacterized protein LOC123882822 isoform X2 [Trifolium pratense]